MKTDLIAQVNFSKLKEAFPGGSLPARADLSLGVIISELLKYLFVFAGLALLAYLIIGGFSLMTSGGDPKKIEAGKGAITNAILGFLIIFAAYWITQIVALVFNLDVGVFK